MTFYEVIVCTDDGYYTVVATKSREHADALVERGNSLLWNLRYIHFEARERKVVDIDPAAWTRQDFIDAIDHPEPEDWFVREDEDDD